MSDKKKNAEGLLAQMDRILDNLIENALRLNDLSVQVTAEEELTTFQKEEEHLIQELEQLDAQFKATQIHAQQPYESALHDLVLEKLERFVKLNQQYVDNLKTTHGIIQFEADIPKIVKK